MSEGFLHRNLSKVVVQAGHTPVGLHPYPNIEARRAFMMVPLYVNAHDVREAQMLISQFGIGARQAAAERAEASRNVGNHIHFCRWRQIERLVKLLSFQSCQGTLH